MGLGLGVGLGAGLGASLLLIADFRCTIPGESGSGYRCTIHNHVNNADNVDSGGECDRTSIDVAWAGHATEPCRHERGCKRISHHVTHWRKSD